MEEVRRKRVIPVEEDARRETLKLRLNNEESSYLDALAKELGWTKSEVIRRGVSLVGICKDILKKGE